MLSRWTKGRARIARAGFSYFRAHLYLDVAVDQGLVRARSGLAWGWG